MMEFRFVNRTPRRAVALLAVLLLGTAAAAAKTTAVDTSDEEEAAAGLRRRANNGNGNGNGNGGNPFDDPGLIDDSEEPPSHTLNEITCHLIETQVDTPLDGGGYTEYMCVPPSSDEDTGAADMAYALNVEPGFVAEYGDRIRAGEACVSVSGSKSRGQKNGNGGNGNGGGGGDKIVQNLARRMKLVECDPEAGLGPRRGKNKGQGQGQGQFKQATKEKENRGKADKMLRNLQGDDDAAAAAADSRNRQLSILDGPAPSVGIKSVLVLRVTAADASNTATATQIANSIFGPAVGMSDQVNLHTQMLACSHSQLDFQPALNDAESNGNIVNGVAEVSIGMDATGADRGTVRNAITEAAPGVVGDLSRFDHVMYCFPPGTVSSDGGGWIANAYKPGWMSNYNDDWCMYPSGQMHEIGHNLGLSHSGEDGSTYSDQSGLMGYSYSDDESPRMCFNGPKSWQLGWYATHTDEFDPLRQFDWVGKLVGADDYSRAVPGQHTLVLKVIEENDPFEDLYVMYNSKKGINAETKEDSNAVTITRGGHSTSSSNLNDGVTPYIVQDFDGSGYDLIVELCSTGEEAGTMDANGDDFVDYAHVAVYLDDGNRASPCPGTARMQTVSPAPTPAPINWFETIFDYEYKNYGNMFDIEAKENDVDITEWWVSPNDAGTYTFKVYIREGTWVGSEFDEASWTLVGEGSVATEEDTPMALPSSIVGPSNPISLERNTKYGMYVTMDSNQLKYTKAVGLSQGQVFNEDDNVKLYVGTRTYGFPFATTKSSSPYVVNTFFKYSTTSEVCSVDADCEDGDLCNGVRSCVGSVCQPPTGIVNCDDATTCTTDTCAPSTGLCSYTDVTCPDDGDACTEGICDSALGCQNVPIQGCSHLETELCHSSSTGASCYSNMGNFFDVEASGSNDIDIHTMTIYARYTGTCTVNVYVRDAGTWIDHHDDVGTAGGGWALAASGEVDTEKYETAVLPPSVLSRANPIRIPANGGKKGVLVVLSEPSSLYYSSSTKPRGDLVESDGNLSIFVGTRAYGYPHPTSISGNAYIFNGVLSYDVVEGEVSTTTTTTTTTPECTQDSDCADTVFCNGAEICDGGNCQLGTPIVCTDGIDCTIDTCTEGTSSHICVATPSDALCDNGDFCDGIETCDELTGCESPGSPCDDSGDFPFCLEATDACVECTQDSDCADAVFCNGAELCVAGTCQPGTAVVCPNADGFDCTIETCDPEQDVCVSTPSDALCDNGYFCDGTERCVAGQGCVTGTPFDCSDDDLCTDDKCTEGSTGPICTNTPKSCASNGDYCDGAERCNGSTGNCESVGTPCDDSDFPVCLEATDDCVECAADGDCASGEQCETGTNVCVQCVDSSGCADGQVCDTDANQCTSTTTTTTAAESLVLNDPADDCSSSSPCAICKGDCDHDGQCAGGGVSLVCFERSGTTAVPGCQGSGQSSKDYCYKVEDAPTNQLLFKGESSCSGSVPCSDPFPLGECEGDCDSDEQCAGTLVCSLRGGTEAVPGCVGLGINGRDYCHVPAASTSTTQDASLVLNNPADDCSSASPCGTCKGDCDHDGHCADGGVSLVCFDRSGTTPVPGCQGDGQSSKDYCYRVEDAPSNHLLYKGESEFPLGECHGDCDSDSDCAVGLECSERGGTEAVPGCVGLGVRGKDHCYDPTKCVPDGGRCSTATASLCCGQCNGNGRCG